MCVCLVVVIVAADLSDMALYCAVMGVAAKAQEAFRQLNKLRKEVRSHVLSVVLSVVSF